MECQHCRKTDKPMGILYLLARDWSGEFISPRIYEGIPGLVYCTECMQYFGGTDTPEVLDGSLWVMGYYRTDSPSDKHDPVFLDTPGPRFLDIHTSIGAIGLGIGSFYGTHVVDYHFAKKRPLWVAENERRIHDHWEPDAHPGIFEGEKIGRLWVPSRWASWLPYKKWYQIETHAHDPDATADWKWRWYPEEVESTRSKWFLCPMSERRLSRFIHEISTKRGIEWPEPTPDLPFNQKAEDAE